MASKRSDASVCAEDVDAEIGFSGVSPVILVPPVAFALALDTNLDDQVTLQPAKQREKAIRFEGEQMSALRGTIIVMYRRLTPVSGNRLGLQLRFFFSSQVGQLLLNERREMRFGMADAGRPGVKLVEAIAGVWPCDPTSQFEPALIDIVSSPETWQEEEV